MFNWWAQLQLFKSTKNEYDIFRIIPRFHRCFEKFTTNLHYIKFINGNVL